MIKKLHLTKGFVLLALIVFMLFPGLGWGQNIFFDGFETGNTDQTAVAGWTQESVTGTGIWTANSTLITYNRAPRTGTFNAYLVYGNTRWMFKSVTLTGGTPYKMTVYARQDGTTSTDASITLKYGSTGTAAGMTNSIVSVTGIVASYQLIQGAFTPAASGTYYVGILGTINSTPWYISIDDISLDVAAAANAAPLSFTSTAVTTSGMTIGWTDNSTNETTFRLYRSTDNITFVQQGADIASTSTATTGTTYSQVQSGLVPGTTYYYRIAAVLDAESSYLTGNQTTLAPPPPISGTKVIPSAYYPTFAAAFDSIANKGIGTGGVIFNVTPGYTETASNLILTKNILYPPTAANPITFQKNGAGANPLISRTDAGTNTTTVLGGLGDAVIRIDGADYISFDGIDVSATQSTIEYGYYTYKPSGTDGCQNTTIKNSSISMTKGTSAYVIGIYISNGASTVSSATGVSVTAASGQNQNIVITGNTIQNVFAGIIVRGSSATGFYDNNITIGQSGAGNIIQNYGSSSAASTYGVYFIYVNNPSVAYNTINNAGGGGAAHTATLYGIFYSNVTGDVIGSNNTITLANSATSGVNWIYNGNACTSTTFNNNTFAAGAFAATTASYLIFNSNATNSITVTGNATSGTITKTGAGTLYGFYNNGSPTGGTSTISGNNFSNIVLTGASAFTGIQHSTSTTQIVVFANNTISNITGGSSAVIGLYEGYGAAGSSVNGNSVFNLSGTGAVTGIALGQTTAPLGLTAFNNTVYGLSTTGAATVIGILNTLGAANQIYKNSIYNLSANNAAGLINGIQVTGGVGTYIFNNLISDLRAPITSSATAIYGINITSSTATSTVGLYNNSIYMNASTSGTNFGTAGIFHTYSTTATTATLDMRNNIIVNNSTPKGTGLTVAFRRSASTNLNNYSTSSNNNDFYAGATEDATHAVYYNGTAVYAMAAYKTLVSPREAVSFREIPPFNNVATTPNNLHLAAGTPTQCESGGLPVTTPIAITDDFDGNTRNASTPDIGADEGSFTILDLVSPTIAYTPLLNTSSTSARTITVTITDVSGVGAGVNLPVMYWAINAGAYTGPLTPTTIVGNQYTYTLGSGVVLGDVVKYFFVAQDQATTPNIVSAPSGATVTASPPLASAPPATPSTYTILGCISGTKTVGTGGDYTTLTAAITALNNSELCGPLTLSLTDASYTTETLPLVVNANTGSSATNTVTIKPATGVTASVSGASATGTVFKIMNNYTIIDGSNSAGTSRDLTITNTSATAPNVLILCSTGIVPLTGVTVKNTILINGSNTSTAVMVSDVAGTAGYFTNITIQNNSVQKAYIGIYAIATVAAGNGNGLLVTGNDLSTSGANSIRLIGVYVQGVDGTTISNNQIGNIVNANAESPKGIWLATGTNSATISGNTFSNLSLTNTGAYALTGIYVNPGTTATNISVSNNTISTLANSGTALAYAGILSFSPNTSITNNTVTGLTQNGAAAFWGIVQSGAVNSSCSGNTVSAINTSTTGVPCGINIQGASTGVAISKNKIYNIKNTNAGGYSAIGLALNSSSGTANTTASNNLIFDIAGYGYASQSTDNGFGINILSGGGYNLYFNTVNLATNQTDGTGVPACLIINSAVTALNSLDIRDNIFSIPATVGTNRYAVISNAANTVFSEMNYNDYYTSGSNIGYIGGIDRTNLAAWQTGTGKDASSISGDPLFVSATDLHLNTALSSPAKNAGYALATVTTDIDGDTRNNPPDIGADDYSLVPTVTTTAATLVTGSTATINGTVTANNESVAAAFEYGTTIAFGTTVAATPTPVTGNTSTGISYGLTGLIPNTTYYFQAKGTVGTFVYNGLPPLSFTTLAILPTVTTDAATSVTSTGAVMNGTVNANNASTATSFEYGLTTAYGTSVAAVPSPATGVSATSIAYTLSSLVPNTTYHYRAVGVNSAGTANGLDLTFTTTAIAPVVVTVAATSVTSTGAIMNGTVNANNASTATSFEYGLTTAYGTSVTAVPSPATGVSATSITYTLTGLVPSTTYHYRAVGVNSAGTTNGSDLTFTTSAALATVVTVAATSVTSNGAVMNGTVNANNASTVTSFEYGLTIAYGTSVTAVPSPVTGVSATSIAYTLSGLVPNTTYHYRAVGVNIAGTANGLDLTFTTTAVVPAVVTVAATSVTSTGAIVNGTVNANNASTTTSFEYGLTVAYGTSVTAVPSLVTGVSATSIAYTLTGLVPSTTYHYRAVGVNSAGTTNGSDLTFTTSAAAPTVITTAATGVGTNTATLNGTVNANNQTATVTFEYGLTTAYGTIVSATPSSVTGSSVNSVSAAISGLSLNTTYHCRAVAVNATGTTNGNDITFTTGCQVPGAAGTITGPASICQSTSSIVFSVGVITNAVTYVWSVPTGATIVSGSTTNSITVDFGAAAASGNVTVYGSGVCGNGTASSLAITLNARPVPVITGPATACVNSTGNVYSTATGMTGYTWTVSSGGTITAGAGTNSITVSWNTAGGQNVYVNYTNAGSCAATTPSVKSVTVNALPVPTITGLAAACTGTTGVTYTTETGMTGYTWTISAGGTITAGATTNVITVTWSTAGAQTVSVNYANSNGCTAGTAIVKNVTVNALPVPTITGLAAVCAGTTGVTYTTETGMTGYTWTVSSGGTITAGAGTNTITVSWNTVGAQNVYVNYINANGCTATTPSVKSVSVNALPVPTITGLAAVCVGTTGVTYTTETGMTGYTWTVSAGGTITAGAGTNMITVSWTTTGSKNVYVNYTNANGCSATTATVKIVTVNALPVPTITGLAAACAGTTGVTYTTETGMTGYTWTISAGGTITAGAGTNVITVTWSTAGAQTASVNYTNSNGCTAATTTVKNVTVNPLPVPTITGLAAACVGTTGVTYTTEAAMTGYTWTVSSGGAITAGAGTNTITVSWNTVGAQNVYVNYINTNGCTATTPSVKSVTVNALPVPTITGLAAACVGSTGVTYTTETSMTGYSWTVSAGGTITAGATTNVITVTWTTVGAKNVYVNYVNANGCTATTPTVKVVTVNALPVPTIVGPSFACAGTTGAVYTTETGMTGYTWTVSAGGTITAGAGTNAVTVSWNTAGARTVSVNYVNANGCTASTAATFSVTVAGSPAPTITGPAQLCAGATGVVYTTQAGFSNYVWTISYGGIITSGLNSNQVTVDWGTAGLRSISVNYENASACSAVSPFVYNVTIFTAPVPVITGNASVCQGTTGVTYTTQADNTGYVWTVSSGGVITSGAGTNEITVSWITGGNQTVSVDFTNELGCDAAVPTVFNVSVAPKPSAAGAVTGTTPVCAGTQGVAYSVPAIANATTYNWTLPTGATVASGASTNAITVNFAPTAASGVIKVNGVNDCGSGTVSPSFNVVVNPLPATPVITRHGDTLTSSANSGNQWYLDGVIIPGATAKQHVAVYTGNYTVVVTLSGCSSATSNSILVLPVSVGDFEVSHTFDLYPNPNQGQFNIKVVSAKPLVLNLEVYNNLGALLWKQEKVTVDGTYTTPVDLGNVPNGVYMVSLRNTETNSVRKVVIMK